MSSLQIDYGWIAKKNYKVGGVKSYTTIHELNSMNFFCGFHDVLYVVAVKKKNVLMEMNVPKGFRYPILNGYGFLFCKI